MRDTPHVAAVLDFLIDAVGQLLLGWVPERGVLKWAVLTLYAALFALAVVLAVRALS